MLGEETKGEIARAAVAPRLDPTDVARAPPNVDGHPTMAHFRVRALEVLSKSVKAKLDWVMAVMCVVFVTLFVTLS